MLFATQIILLFIILATSIPAGMLLARLCRDELKAGKKWFKLIGVACVIFMWIFIFLHNDLVIVGTLAYAGILASVALIKGKKEN